jgi:methionyl-tRNA synthetase
MSKSRGTGVSPDVYLDLGLDPEWLRYYLAAKLNAHVEDLDFNPDDFIARVNSDLVGKYVNIASRAAPFITRTSTARSARRPSPDADRAQRLALAQMEAETARAAYERASSAACCATR